MSAYRTVQTKGKDKSRGSEGRLYEALKPRRSADKTAEQAGAQGENFKNAKARKSNLRLETVCIRQLPFCSGYSIVCPPPPDYESSSGVARDWMLLYPD